MASAESEHGWRRFAGEVLIADTAEGMAVGEAYLFDEYAGSAIEVMHVSDGVRAYSIIAADSQ